jgi:hypothetical protein
MTLEDDRSQQASSFEPLEDDLIVRANEESESANQKGEEARKVK